MLYQNGGFHQDDNPCCRTLNPKLLVARANVRHEVGLQGVVLLLSCLGRVWAGGWASGFFFLCHGHN